MRHINVLTPGFVTPNGRGFLFPLIVHERRLGSMGLRLGYFNAIGDGLTDCDVLIIDSKFFAPKWAAERFNRTLDEVAELAARSPVTVFFDQSDSTGWLQAQVLPYVTAYRKAQLLRDRRAYLQPHYGNRIYADYYHRKYGVEDEQPYNWRELKDESLLGKLGVSWNFGLANYGYAGLFLAELYGRIPWPALLRRPSRFASPAETRPIDVSCRVSTSYERATVAWQRKAVVERLSHLLPTGRLSRRQYFRELQTSKIVVSPFGYGEINFRDFEAFISGALLLKPDMSHLETWPDLFEPGVTIETHAWDLSDLEEKIETVLAESAVAVEIAAEGQCRYRHHVAEEGGGERFCRHFLGIVDDATTVASP